MKRVPLCELMLQVICVFRSRQSWSLSVEKHRSSCGPECLVSGGAFLRGSLSDDLCFLLPSPSPFPPPPPPPPCCVLELPRAPETPSLNGLCTEFQCISSFLDWAVGRELELTLSPSLLLLAGPMLPLPLLLLH